MNVQACSVVTAARAIDNLKLTPVAGLLPGEPCGMLGFACRLDAERRRLDRLALQAALETLQAEEGK